MALFSTVDRELYCKEHFPETWDVRIQYLGTAGFVFECQDHTLVVDPYITRPGIWPTLTQKLVPDPALIASYIPKADDVLIGHAHHDHALDAPDLCKMTGARLIGSHSTCNIGRAAGLPEHQMLEISGGEEISCGPHTVRGLPSRHGKVALGRIPLPGIISSVPQWPMRVTAFRHGQVFNWHLNLNGVRIVHIDSADFIDEELGVERADILCLCAAGRKYRPDYVATAIELLKPSIVIPCHWDIFTTPIAAPPLLIPGIHLDGMMNEIRECGSRAVLLPILGEYGYSKTS